MTKHWLALPLAAGLSLTLGPAEAEESIDELDERLRVVERKLSGEALTDMVNNLRQTRDSLDDIRGQLESIQRRLDELEERQREMYGELDERIRKLETASPSGTDSSDDSESTDGESDASNGNDEEDTNNAARSADEEQQYSEAFETLRSGNYEAARKQFERLLENHPDGEFADNARYWLGESHYVVRDFDKARKAFKAVLDNHPDSAKRPDALLKIGFIDYEQDNMDSARKTLNRVIDEHPDTTAAEQARKRLQRLNN